MQMNKKHYNHELLRVWRRQRGLTLRQVANEIGVERNTIWRIEAGRSASYETLYKLCGFYGGSMADLLYLNKPAAMAA